MDVLRTIVPGAYTPQQRAVGIILFLAYLVANQIGIELFTSPAVIVPAAGIALAGLVLGGIVLWPAIYLAALLSLALNGASPLSLLIMPVAHTLQAVIGAYILKQVGFDPFMRRLRDMFAIISIAFTVSAIVPSFEFIVRFLNTLVDIPPTAELTWESWWTGHILSLLLVTPLIIRWFAEPYFYRLSLYRQPWKIAEIAIVFLVLITLTWLPSYTPYTQLGGITLVYFLLVPLFWLAIRIGPRFTILGLFIIAVMVIGGTLYGPMAPAPQLGLRLFQLEIFLIILAVIFYIIAGLQEERTEASKSLTSYIEKLEDALNRLSLQDRAKNDFIAVLAHELRNPLAPIVSTIELLRINHPKTGEEGEAIDLIDNRLKVVQRLLDDLLDVSRISRSKLKIKKEPVDLRTVTQSSIQAIERYIKNREQKLVIDLPEEPLILQADPVRLEQIITNLLTNASKFTNQGGRLVIAIKREGDFAKISVSDNGIGIDPVMLTRIFEPFLQLETGDRKGEGLGIGLSLTQRLAEMHGGTVEAYSRGISYGSEFIVRLPIIPAYESTPVSENKPAVNKTAETTRRQIRGVLVVDDNIAAAHGIGKLLTHKGFDVLYAYTGSEAKEKIVAVNPDAVILDIGLPDMDGFDLAKMLRVGLGYTGLLIALTGYGQEEDKQRAREAGFNHHVTKPVSIAELHALLTDPERK